MRSPLLDSRPAGYKRGTGSRDGCRFGGRGNDVDVIGETLGGRYTLLSLLGKGGMASVYRARDERLEREVAVKVLSTDGKSDPTYAARFQQEAKLSAQLRHPGLVEVFDVGMAAEEGSLYLVMELLEGAILGEFVGKEGLEPDVFYPLAIEISAGVAVLHDARVVHRDLSAGNVMLVRRGDGSLHAKVLDLGIAKAFDAKTLTEAGTFIGTLESMAPEQIRGEVLDARADVYALGVLFYRMLVGAPPFAGEAATLMYHHLQVVPPALDSRSKWPIPAALGDLVARCLEKAPSKRPASAGALVLALKAVREGRTPQLVTSPSAATDTIALAASVPDLDLGHAPARAKAPGPSASASAAPLEGGPSNALRRETVLELDTEGSSEPLELASVERKSVPSPHLPSGHAADPPCPICGSPLHASAIACTACGHRPHGAMVPVGASGSALAEVAKVPVWLAPLGILPVQVGKRVAVYGFAFAFLSAFFRGVTTFSLGLAGLSALAALGTWVRSRLDDER